MSLKIAINAQLVPDKGAGGPECVLVGLVQALARLDGPEQYVVVGPWEHPDWLKPYIGPNQCIVRGPKSQALKRALRPVKPLIKMVRHASSWAAKTEEAWPRVAQSRGFYERLQCSVIHFPYQQFVASTIPSVFNPHDLQHVHYPEFFSHADFQWREITYGTACRAADTVVVPSEWVKHDVARHYSIEPGKIQVILTPPPIQVCVEPTSVTLHTVKNLYNLGTFALYPAMTGERKNHVRLLEALAFLRDRRGIRVNLVCTGHQTNLFPKLQKRVRELQLQDQVQFLGMIPAEHLRALYRLAQFTVLPTLFEGAGLPLVEAWMEGAPVACSAVTSLLELSGDAALLFDPQSVESIAEAIAKMSTDASLRETLTRRGRARIGRFNWEDAAKAYRAVYRRVANHPLTEEDRWILNRNGARDLVPEK